MRALAACVLLLVAASAHAQPVRIAAPGLSGVNLDEAIVEFFSEHFAQQMALRGVSVVTAAEIATLIGLERQRQLVGCSDDSGACLTEIADALGVEALITGSIARFGGTLQANLKVIRASDARPLSLISRTANTEDAMFEALINAADLAAREVLAALRPGVQAKLDTSRAGLGPITYRVLRNNVVRVEALTALAGGFAAEYERVLADYVSATARPAYLALITNGRELPGVTRGVDLTLGPRVYPFRRAPSGLWFGPELRTAWAWEGPGAGFHLGTGLAAGWNFVGDALPFVVSTAIGLAYFPGGSSPLAYPLDGRISFSLGWAF